METINSLQNRAVKEAKKLQQKKYREERGQYLVEGVRMVEEGIRAGSLTCFFYNLSLRETKRGEGLWHTIREYAAQTKSGCFQVSEKVLRTLAETETPQGIVAVARMNTVSLSSILEKREEDILAIIDGLQDPGNLGTLLRTVWAGGGLGAVCLPGTVDPYNGKSVRSTMGSIFRIPVVTGQDWPTVRDWCRSRGYRFAAGDVLGREEYFNVAYPGKIALVIGSEGHGLVNVPRDEVDFCVRIPLRNGVESLNAAVAGSILFYEIIRQKSGKPCHSK
ncbi:MAG: RNA methyltransferase [Peptococcaceae bacterium]|nr:RNA methyltransferase [Peptococcaceae bacterium]MDH7523879.1 RNA methyltransferase [Peptococcaceae bacterium]